MSPRYAMIMAGGSGTRLWPLSRHTRPKQLLPMGDGRSLLEHAAMRLEDVVAHDHRLICAAEMYRAAIRTALPSFTDDMILGEPMGRDTVNAVGLTAAVLARRDPDAVFAVLTSDHLIEPVETFRNGLETGFALIENDPSRFVTFGIKPTFAATNFGWVKNGPTIAGFDRAAIAVAFDEKPDQATADTYYRDPAFRWNSGTFVFSAAGFLDTLARYEPAAYDGLSTIAEAWDKPHREEVLATIYPTLPKISVDYAVMKPAARDNANPICCVPLDVTWLDVGSWTAYGETLEPAGDGHRTNANLVALDAENVLAVADDPAHTIAVIGLKDIIVVRTADATLICPASASQRVKKLVERLEERLR